MHQFNWNKIVIGPFIYVIWDKNAPFFGGATATTITTTNNNRQVTKYPVNHPVKALLFGVQSEPCKHAFGR